METSSPSLGKVITMVLFALSCIGLLLFLWIEFGGTIPFNAQGYRFKVAFPYAQELATPAQVRIAGVNVGKVVSTQYDGNRTLATIQMNNQYAPIRRDTRAILRIKTILGETYVQLTPGSPHSPPLPDGGTLPRGNVQQAVQLDDIFDALNAPTRHAFQQWMTALGKAVQGNDTNLNFALGNLPTFATGAGTTMQVLDIQQAAVQRLIREGAVVFDALTRNETALRNLITTGETTFAATAANNKALAATFHVFPTFLFETRKTMARVQRFALNTDPLLRALEPVALALGPTMHAVQVLSPYLRSLFVQLRPLIQASNTGLPAIAGVLRGASPVLDNLGPFLEQLNPVLTWLSLHQQLISDFISLPGTPLAATAAHFGGTGHYLRTISPLGPDTVTLERGQRSKANRGNTYPPPLWLPSGNFASSDFAHGILPAWDCNNSGVKGPSSGSPACYVAPPLGHLIGQTQKFPHILASSYPSH
jgi:phospholipid/cholesterol/gamma-HCH transport system substrate-binding protein